MCIYIYFLTIDNKKNVTSIYCAPTVIFCEIALFGKRKKM